MLNYIMDNKEWIFSGIGIFLIATVLSFVRKNKISETNQHTANRNTTTSYNNQAHTGYGDNIRGNKVIIHKVDNGK